MAPLLFIINVSRGLRGGESVPVCMGRGQEVVSGVLIYHAPPYSLESHDCATSTLAH